MGLQIILMFLSFLKAHLSFLELRQQYLSHYLLKTNTGVTDSPYGAYVFVSFRAEIMARISALILWQ